MSRAHIYNHNDPDLPSDVMHVLRIMTSPSFGDKPIQTGYQKFMQMKNELKRKASEHSAKSNQTALVDMQKIKDISYSR